MTQQYYQQRRAHKRIFGSVSPTASQQHKIWTKKQKLQLLQAFIRTLNKDNAINRTLFLKCLELHNKLAGDYKPHAEAEASNIIYLTREDNDQAWAASVKKQQESLSMPQKP